MVQIPVHIVAQILSHAAILKLALAKQFGLNPFQFLALVLVGDSKGLSIKALKQRLSLPGSSLTFTIDSLEKKKLIKRHRSREDKRQWFLSLTGKGEQLHEEILETEGEMFSPALDKLSENEKTIFLKLAQEIIQSGTRTKQRQDK
jgi:MarR family 2-MHQ and catechol resistance regulon transcriptional repressor